MKWGIIQIKKKKLLITKRKKWKNGLKIQGVIFYDIPIFFNDPEIERKTEKSSENEKI